MKRLLIVISCLSLILFSCKKSGIPSSSNPPVITSINPGSGHPDTLVTITGNNFSNIPNENIVKFNGVAATVISANATRIIAKVPIGAGNGIITVANNYGTGIGSAFNYLPDIFIIGILVNYAGTKSYLAYWKNGTPTFVTDSNKNCLGYTMAVKDSSIYVPYTETIGNNTYARYWKNGVITNLTDGRFNSGCSSIAISGNDVYISGYVSNGKVNIATYWKNGQPVYLTDSTTDATTTGIVVNGPDVYVIGNEGIPYWDNKAMYWKNGIATVLNSSTANYAGTSNISITNNDVYILGYENYGTSTSYTYEYWKNGLMNALSDGSNIVLDQLMVISNDVYMVGHKSNVAGAVYYKNGVETDLLNGALHGYAHAITSYGSDIYIAGDEYYNQVGIGEYWKNGVLTQVTKNQNLQPAFWTIIVR